MFISKRLVWFKIRDFIYFKLLERLCVTDDYSSSDNSDLEDFTDGDSFEIDGEDIYDTDMFDSDQSDSDNYGLPTYDNLESEYDSSMENRPFSDQPRKRPINPGREAPISFRVQEKARFWDIKYRHIQLTYKLLTRWFPLNESRLVTTSAYN